MMFSVDGEDMCKSIIMHIKGISANFDIDLKIRLWSGTMYSVETSIVQHMKEYVRCAMFRHTEREVAGCIS